MTDIKGDELTQNDMNGFHHLDCDLSNGCIACTCVDLKIKEILRIELGSRLAEREDVLNHWPPTADWMGWEFLKGWVRERGEDQLTRITELRNKLDNL